MQLDRDAMSALTQTEPQGMFLKLNCHIPLILSVHAQNSPHFYGTQECHNYVFRAFSSLKYCVTIHNILVSLQ